MKGDRPNIDWVLVEKSNAHICNSLEWFTKYYPFSSIVTVTIGGQTAIWPVFGVGEVKFEQPSGERGDEGYLPDCTVGTVLFVPDSLINIFGLGASDINVVLEACGAKLQAHKSGIYGGRLDTSNAPPNDLRVTTRSMTAQSELHPSRPLDMQIIWKSVIWDTLKKMGGTALAKEMTKKRYNRRQLSWLKRNYGDEAKFLQSHGLSIEVHEDRNRGAQTVVDEMEASIKDPGERDALYAVEEHDDPKIEHYREEGFVSISGSSDKVLTMADSLFEKDSLEYIRKHYEDSGRFMLSYGLRPWDEDDCDDAKRIVRKSMKTA